MGNTLKRQFQKLFGRGQNVRRILLLGLDSAGKTTLLYQLIGEPAHTVPTVGFNVERVAWGPLEFIVWDVSGQDKLRSFWRHYYHGAEGVVFIVDCNDTTRFDQARDELHGLMQEVELEDSCILVLANKQDLPDAVSPQDLDSMLQLDILRMKGRRIHVQASVASKGEGLADGMTWLAETLSSSHKDTVRESKSSKHTHTEVKTQVARASGKEPENQAVKGKQHKLNTPKEQENNNLRTHTHTHENRGGRGGGTESVCTDSNTANAFADSDYGSGDGNGDGDGDGNGNGNGNYNGNGNGDGNGGGSDNLCNAGDDKVYTVNPGNAMHEHTTERKNTHKKAIMNGGMSTNKNITNGRSKRNKERYL